MPASVKAFFGLSVALALWCMGDGLFALYFPSSEYVAALARVPQAFRKMIIEANFQHTLFAIGTYAVPLMLFALLATFARVRWARWGLVVFFVARDSAPFFHIALVYLASPHLFYEIFQPFGGWWHYYLQSYWSSWWPYADLATQLALIILIFSPNARPWFRKRAA
jgi:hypothetical protein